MAGQPRFTSMPSGNGGFRMNFAGPPQPLVGMMRQQIHNGGPLAPSAGGGGPPKNSQVTTVFVGNISEKADNEFVKQMLEMCGKVVAWKRMAGVSGKLQVFGFCDFEEPEDTLRALRVLNEFQLGDKKLIVKVEQKHRDQLKAFAEKEAGTAAKLNSEELPASDKSLRKDENVRLKILEAIEKDYPDLVKFEDGELEEKEKEGAKLKDSKKEVEESKDRRESRRTKRSRSRSGSRSRSPSRRERGRRSSPRNKPRRRSSRSSSQSSSDSRSSRSSSGSSYDSRDRKRRLRRSRSASKATYASDDSEDAREKRAVERQVKEKEMAYAARLREWEGREKKMAKKYEKDESREKSRKLDVHKEAKKLKAFFEDYDDEKDDLKFYKSSALFGRRREFEREKEADERDRLKEQAEIEELKKQIVEESKAKVKQEEMEIKEVKEEARRRHEQKVSALNVFNDDMEFKKVDLLKDDMPDPVDNFDLDEDNSFNEQIDDYDGTIQSEIHGEEHVEITGEIVDNDGEMGETVTSEKNSSENTKKEKTRRSSRNVGKHNYNEDAEPLMTKSRSESKKKNEICKVSKITVVQKGDGTKKEPKAPRINHTELECPECEIRTKSAQYWCKHLSQVHSTTPTQAGLVLRCECGNESFSDEHSRYCEISKITVVRMEDGTTEPKVSRINHTELECPECEFRSMSVGSWVKHLYNNHSTTPTRAGLVLRCECGNESVGAQHSIICKISKITVVRYGDGTTKKLQVSRVNHTESECPECEYRTKSVGGWMYHLYTSHSSSPTQAGLVLRCECGHESLSDQHARSCKISKITVVRKKDGTAKK